MTPDASPPADVQRPEPLTEEELAEIEAYTLIENVRRLIADLRASRAKEVAWAEAAATYRAEVERLREDARENYARAEQAEQELQRLKATAHLP